MSVTSQSSTNSSTHVCSTKDIDTAAAGRNKISLYIRTECTSVVVPQMNSKRVYPCASKFGMNA